MMGSLDCNSI